MHDKKVERKPRPVMLKVKSPASKIAGPELCYRWRQTWHRH